MLLTLQGSYYNVDNAYSYYAPSNTNDPATFCDDVWGGAAPRGNRVAGAGDRTLDSGNATAGAAPRTNTAAAARKGIR
jgi:hypothetical protein